MSSWFYSSHILMHHIQTCAVTCHLTGTLPLTLAVARNFYSKVHVHTFRHIKIKLLSVQYEHSLPVLALKRSLVQTQYSYQHAHCVLLQHKLGDVLWHQWQREVTLPFMLLPVLNPNALKAELKCWARMVHTCHFQIDTNLWFHWSHLTIHIIVFKHNSFTIGSSEIKDLNHDDGNPENRGWSDHILLTA